MQHLIHVDPVARLGYVRLVGPVNTQDVLALTAQVFEHPDWQAGFDELWDALRVTETVIEMDEIRAALAVDEAMMDWVGDGKVAIVVARDLDHAVARIYQSMSRMLSHREYEVFRSYKKALAWLGHEAMPAQMAALSQQL